MAKKYTHECLICGKPYIHCDKSKRYGSWRAICCSPECFQKYMAPKSNIKDKDNGVEREAPKKTK